MLPGVSVWVNQGFPFLFSLLPSAVPLEEQEKQLMDLKQQKSDLILMEKQLASKREEHKVYLRSLRTAFDSEREK